MYSQITKDFTDIIASKFHSTQIAESVMDRSCHLIRLPCTIDKAKEPCQLLIQTVWQKDGDIEISLLYPSSSNDGYVGCLQRNGLKSTAASLEIAFDLILSETTKALTTNGGISNFLYDLDTQIVEFVLRKQTGSLNVICGRVPLKAVPSLKDALLQRAIDVNITNSNRLTDMSLQFENLKREYAEMTSAFEACLAQKSSLEAELLAKFIVLLKRKNDQISFLPASVQAGTSKVVPSAVAINISQPTRTSQESDDVIERVLPDSLESMAIVLPRRSVQAERSKVVPAAVASLPTVLDSESIFDQNTDELLNIM